MIELVAFIRLEGVNYVFSHVFLILVATFYSSIFAKLLLTTFFAPFSAARESDFLSNFSYLWHSELVHYTWAPIFLAQNMWVSWSKTLSAFCQRFLVQTSVGRTRMIPFLLTRILELTFSRLTLALLSYAVQLGYGIPKGFSNLWVRLIVGFLALHSRQ